jgi:LacI family transcriptional regulator
VRKHQLVIGLHLGLHTEGGHRVLRGVLDYADQHPAISLADFCFTEDTPVPRGAPPWTGKVDGVVMSAAYDPRMVSWVKNGGVPTVNAGSDLMDTSIVSVFSSPESLARRSVEHLHGIGYRNFLYMGVPKSGGSRRRRNAISEELKERGCKLHGVDVAREDLEGKRIDRRVASALTRIEKPLAIVALNDTYAVLIASLVQQLGFRIPDAVGILGVGDTAMARISSPPISTIRTAQERTGDEAARLVHRMIEGRRLASKNVAVPGEELIVRASTVPKRRSNGGDIQQALELIRRKACEGIKIPEIAGQLHMSVRALELQFAEEVGHPVGEELRRVRLEKAKELLLRADLSLTRIATLIGYANNTYFTRFFLQHTGQTPSEFRRQRK